MLSCLTLIGHTHVRIDARGDRYRTACGISVLGGDAPDLFAEPADTATCVGCREATGAARTSADPKAVVLRFFDEVVNGALPAGRRVVVKDLIAEGQRVVVRYRVDDGAGRLTGQTAIFRTSGRHVVEIEAVVDELGVLKDLSTSPRTPRPQEPAE